MRSFVRSWSASLLLLCLLPLSGCGKRNAAGTAIDSRLAAFVSADATVLADVQLDAIRNTSFFKRHQDQLDFPMLKGMGQQLGFDPINNLSEALVIWNGHDAVIVASGHFSSERAEAQLAKTNPPVTYKSARIYGAASDALAFLNGGLLAAGKLPALERTIDVSESHSGALPDELRTQLGAIEGGSQIRVASRGGLPFADISMGPDAASALSNLAGYVSSTHTGIAFDSGLELRSTIACISEQGARRVSDAFRGSLGMARLSTRSEAMDLLRLWDAIQISQDRERVSVKANLPDDLADQLLTRALSFSLSGRMPKN